MDRKYVFTTFYRIRGRREKKAEAANGKVQFYE